MTKEQSKEVADIVALADIVSKNIGQGIAISAFAVFQYVTGEGAWIALIFVPFSIVGGSLYDWFIRPKRKDTKQRIS